MVLLNLPQIVENQASAYVTSNDADSVIEKALCEGKLDHDASLGDFSMLAAMYQENWFHRITGAAAAALTLTIPATKRPFMVQNSCGKTVTITTSLGGGFPVLDTEIRLLYCDGANVIGLTDTSAVSSIVPTFSGAMVTLSSNFAITHNTVTAVNWATSTYDSDAYFDGGSPSRFTVPVGVSKILLRGQIRWVTGVTGTREVLFLKNGSAVYPGRAYVADPVQSKLIMNLTSPVLDVVPGDYFDFAVYQDAGADRHVETGSSSWFSIQAVG